RWLLTIARRVIPASASMSTVCNPARAVNVAALAPAGPPPTIATSYIACSSSPSQILVFKTATTRREPGSFPRLVRSGQQLEQGALGPDAGHFAFVGGGAAQVVQGVDFFSDQGGGFS